MIKLGLIDTLILSAGVASAAALFYFLTKGWLMDAYFPGMFALGFFLWFLYRKGEAYKSRKPK
jgi:hypothetical protein